VITFTEDDFVDALKTPAAMAFLGVKCELTMIRWRKGLHGGGPPCLRVGRDYLYPRVYLERFKIQREANKAMKRVAVSRRHVVHRTQLRAAIEAQGTSNKNRRSARRDARS